MSRRAGRCAAGRSLRDPVIRRSPPPERLGGDGRPGGRDDDLALDLEAAGGAGDGAAVCSRVGRDAAAAAIGERTASGGRGPTAATSASTARD